MIRIENQDVHGWVAAIRGARNPMNSWDKSDSYFDVSSSEMGIYKHLDEIYGITTDCMTLGDNDYRLLRNLANAGPDHGKFLRFITVTMDITAPLYWWKEFDTYKVGTVANSCSTMHKIHAKEFTLDDFSHEHMSHDVLDVLTTIINALNIRRKDFLDTKEKTFWWDMIQLLPTSYNQRRTVLLNYQVLKSMYHARRNHKLDEWRIFCDFIRDLPYSELIIGGDE